MDNVPIAVKKDDVAQAIDCHEIRCVSCVCLDVCLDVCSARSTAYESRSAVFAGREEPDMFVTE